MIPIGNGFIGELNFSVKLLERITEFYCHVFFTKIPSNYLTFYWRTSLKINLTKKIYVAQYSVAPFSRNKLLIMKYFSFRITFWVILRCVSFCLDNLWSKVNVENNCIWNFIKMVNYCLYIPLCFNGPLITYQAYSNGVSSTWNGQTWPQ